MIEFQFEVLLLVLFVLVPPLAVDSGESWIYYTIEDHCAVLLIAYKLEIDSVVFGWLLSLLFTNYSALKGQNSLDVFVFNGTFSLRHGRFLFIEA